METIDSTFVDRLGNERYVWNGLFHMRQDMETLFLFIINHSSRMPFTSISLADDFSNAIRMKGSFAHNITRLLAPMCVGKDAPLEYVFGLGYEAYMLKDVRDIVQWRLNAENKNKI